MATQLSCGRSSDMLIAFRVFLEQYNYTWREIWGHWLLLTEGVIDDGQYDGYTVEKGVVNSQ